MRTARHRSSPTTATVTLVGSANQCVFQATCCETEITRGFSTPVGDDVAPNFYPVAIGVWRSIMPCWAVVAAVRGAEPSAERSVADRHAPLPTPEQLEEGRRACREARGVHVHGADRA
jgi:hypothetical protein